MSGQGGEASFATPKVRPDDPAVLAIQAALGTGLHWLRANDPAARAGEVAGVHHLRTTTRRLRGSLGLFRDLTDKDWADRLAAELKWLAQALGAVRDLDVLKARLQDLAGEIGVGGDLGPLFQSLGERHAAAAAELGDVLASERYRALVAALADALAALPLAKGAWEPCWRALPPLVRAVWNRLKERGRSLREDDPDETFHEVRKHAKRARHAAEAVRAALDPCAAADADRFARRARRVQDVLGEHQDSVVAAATIAATAAGHPDPGPFHFAAGRLFEREHCAAATARESFFDAWDDLDRKKLRRWLKP